MRSRRPTTHGRGAAARRRVRDRAILTQPPPPRPTRRPPTRDDEEPPSQYRASGETGYGRHERLLAEIDDLIAGDWPAL